MYRRSTRSCRQLWRIPQPIILVDTRGNESYCQIAYCTTTMASIGNLGKVPLVQYEATQFKYGVTPPKVTLISQMRYVFIF